MPLPKPTPEPPDLWVNLYYGERRDTTFANYTEEDALRDPGGANLKARNVHYVPAARLEAVVALVRRLDGNSYPVEGMSAPRQSVSRELLADLRALVAKESGL